MPSCRDFLCLLSDRLQFVESHIVHMDIYCLDEMILCVFSGKFVLLLAKDHIGCMDI